MGHRRGRSSLSSYDSQRDFPSKSIPLKQQLVLATQERASLQIHLQVRQAEVSSLRQQIKAQLEPVKNSLFHELQSLDEQRKLKIDCQNMKNAIKTLQEQIEAQRSYNGENQKIYEDLKKHTTAPAESGIPRKMDVMFRELWKVILRKGLTKQRIQATIQAFTRIDLETWIHRLIPESTRREREGMTMLSVQSGSLCIPSFLSQLSQYQPYPLSEDVQTDIDYLRVALACQEVTTQEAHMKLRNSVEFNVYQMIDLLSDPPFNLPSVAANRISNWLTKGGAGPASFTNLISRLNSWPVLSLITSYLRINFVMKGYKKVTDLYWMLPVPCSPNGFISAISGQIPLSSDAASILIYALFNNEILSVSLLNSHLCAPEGPFEQLFTSFLTRFESEELDCILEKCEEVSETLLNQMTGISGETPSFGRYVSLSEFIERYTVLKKCDLEKNERFAVQVECYQHTRVLDALDANWLKGRRYDLDLEVEGRPSRLDS